MLIIKNGDSFMIKLRVEEVTVKVLNRYTYLKIKYSQNNKYSQINKSEKMVLANNIFTEKSNPLKRKIF